MNRREFLKRTGAALAWLALPRNLVSALPPDEPRDQAILQAPPASLGRIATWWRQSVHSGPSEEAEVAAWKTRDQVIPLHGVVMGKAPWPRNPIWYRINEGFIHSGYVQPVENTPSSGVIIEGKPGFWVRVCVVIAEARSQPNGPWVSYKLYYGTIYRVIQTVMDEHKRWWYRLQDGVTYAPGPYVPAWSVCRIPPEEMAPISPGRTDKVLQVDLEAQRLTCFEGSTAVFTTPISSGAAGTRTPRGEYRIIRKRHTRRMTGGTGPGFYDLPGIAFPTYFTPAGHAVHGTYWHNDFVRPHSHGCVNVPNRAAQWVFRWTDPVVPYGDYEKNSDSEEGTLIVII
ncbi:MAG: L,D-transpeptidase family protein [Chloroflexi bacterium]|nr:L,D-transpeptidase family protein [Chloroflexota bacterium]